MMRARKFHWEKLGIRMAPVFKAFGDLNRMKIIEVLASSPEGSLSVSDLAEVIGISQPATSQHIRVLSNVGILTRKRVKNRTYYSIDSEMLTKYNDIINHMFRRHSVHCESDANCENCPIKEECHE